MKNQRLLMQLKNAQIQKQLLKDSITTVWMKVATHALLTLLKIIALKIAQLKIWQVLTNFNCLVR